MKAQILKLLQLKQLYKRQACGEKYANALFAPKSNAPIGQDINTLIKNCSLCNRIKHCKAPNIGLINQNASLCFISEIPLVSESQAFVQNKSAIMLQNIISNVFKLPFHKFLSFHSLNAIRSIPILKRANFLAASPMCSHSFKALHQSSVCF